MEIIKRISILSIFMFSSHQGFASSPEVREAFQQLLGRPAGSSEIQHYNQRLNEGQDVILDILSDKQNELNAPYIREQGQEDFIANYLAVKSIFATYLDRAPNLSEIHHFTQRKFRGENIFQDILFDYQDSIVAPIKALEAGNNFSNLFHILENVRGAFITFLHREPTRNEVLHFSQRLQQNHDIISDMMKDYKIAALFPEENEILSQLGYKSIAISGENNRCWMRTAWYLVFRNFANNLDELSARLLTIQFANENNDDIVQATNYVMNHLEEVLAGRNYLLGNNGKYPEELEENLFTITESLILNGAYTAYDHRQEYRGIIAENREGTIDMMVSLVRNFAINSIDYISVLHQLDQVFRHDGRNEIHIGVIGQNIANPYPLLVFHSGHHFEIIKPFTEEERQAYHRRLAQEQANRARQAQTGVQGDDSIQWDARGFASNGQHRNGTRYDEDGFDKDGVNLRGFRRNKIHVKTNGLYDEEGFNFSGLDANARDVYGFNAQGFNDQDYTIFGHRGKGLRYEAGQILVQNAGGRQYREPITYSHLGFDQMGFRRSLSYSPAGRNESYDKDGYNPQGLNYLGITKADFKRYGYNAIIEKNMVVEDDLGQLVQTFSAQCFPLYDSTIMFDNITDGAGLQDYVQTMREGDGNFRYSDEEIKNFLKKSIHFCRHFLFAGSLKKETFRSLNNLRIARDHALTTQILDINYGRKLAAAQRRKNLDYIAILKRELTASAVIAAANFIEDGDARLYSNNKIQKIREYFDAYANNNYVIKRDKALYQFRLMAENIGNVSLDDKVAAASLMLHGAAHCPDAKRQAADVSFAQWLPGLNQQLKNERLALAGEDLWSSILADTIAVKEKFYDTWVREKVRRSGQDQNSAYALTWDTYARTIGVDQKGHAYNYSFMRLNLNMDEFFRDGANNGQYTVGNLYQHLDKDSQAIAEIRKNVFGPLFDMIERGNAGLAPQFLVRGGQFVLDHPITRALLVRLGFLTP